jgi:hypothetical protein
MVKLTLFRSPFSVLSCLLGPHYATQAGGCSLTKRGRIVAEPYDSEVLAAADPVKTAHVARRVEVTLSHFCRRSQTILAASAKERSGGSPNRQASSLPNGEAGGRSKQQHRHKSPTGKAAMAAILCPKIPPEKRTEIIAALKANPNTKAVVRQLGGVCQRTVWRIAKQTGIELTKRGGWRTKQTATPAQKPHAPQP